MSRKLIPAAVLGTGDEITVGLVFRGHSTALASTLNIAAFNVGVAVGSVAGGALVDAGLLRFAPLVGAAATLVAVGLARAAGPPTVAEPL